MIDTLKIILGVVATAAATVAAFYVTASFSLAQKQLVAATRLAGYLTHWQTWIAAHDLDLFSVYYQGVKWNEEEREIRKRGGNPMEAVELTKSKKQEFLIQLKERIEKEDFGFDKAELVRNLQRMPKDSATRLLESSKTTSQNIIDGKTFISDEEATSLGIGFTTNCIELKMGILDLVDGATTLLLSLVSAPENFDVKSFAGEISKLLWKGILVSKNIDAIAPAARASSKSVVALTLQNIRNGSRLTKR
jgi:hypothetical protein